MIRFNISSRLLTRILYRVDNGLTRSVRLLCVFLEGLIEFGGKLLKEGLHA